jgi:thioredoxin 1
MWFKEKKIIIIAALLTALGIYAWRDSAGSSSGGEVTAAELRTDLPKMVELFTPTCPSCRAMDPLLTALKQKCEDRGVGVDKIDISKRQNEHLVDELDVLAVPTFVFLDENGQETSRLVGKQTEATLQQHLQALGGRCTDLSG